VASRAQQLLTSFNKGMVNSYFEAETKQVILLYSNYD
jgi:hypothetical protein